MLILFGCLPLLLQLSMILLYLRLHFRLFVFLPIVRAHVDELLSKPSERLSRGESVDYSMEELPKRRLLLFFHYQLSLSYKLTSYI